MTDSTTKSFDCVKSMREARDRLNDEIAEMGYQELVEWLRTHRYSDPFLQRLAEKAAGFAEVATR